ncbi:MAG: hypothetical protein B7X11_00795 [Acidobacteria bacterium 37-65-4]|nr:MAG: hypothetical protein B7X11_00795 [Acidobacteria bacterium 37-65-4]
MTSPLRDEAGWIRLLSATWHRKDAEVGLGDDGCVIPPARYTLSTDVLVEGVDFRRDWAPPEALGYKAMAANLSDLAAMGAIPRFFLMTLGFPRGYPEAFVEGVLRGLHALSDRRGVELCGGDLTRAPGGLFVSLTVIGEQRRRPLLRSGGRPGDVLYVSGSLGGPAEALRRFEAGARLEAFDPLAGPWWESPDPTRGYHETWMARRDGTAQWDALSLLFAADCLWPATVPLGSSGWVPTLQLTTYLRQRPRGAWLRARQRCEVVVGESVDERCELFDERGYLVADSQQIALVRFDDEVVRE